MRTKKKFLHKLFPKSALKYRAYKRLVKDEKSYLYASGWMKSLENMTPMNTNGQPIPWMNYTIIQFLDERLDKKLKLFEFGSGYSTLYYANKVSSVVSVEYDLNWFNELQPKLPANAKIIFKENDSDGEYCRAIHSLDSLFDVIVVDGRDRVNCVLQSIKALTSEGVIILDDSHRERYQNAIELAKRHGFKVLNLSGLKPTGRGVDTTTILYRENNCLGI